MAKAYDVVAVVGEYTNKQGETKKQYLTIGAVIESEKGMSLKLTSIPIGWNGWAGLYVPKEDSAQPKQQAKQQSNDPFSDDAPF